MKKLLSIIFALSLWGVGCGSSAPPAASDADAEVRVAIESYLATRSGLNMSAMALIVDKVDYEGDTAVASVTIQAKNEERAKMQMAYNLRRENGEWKVEPSEAGAGHGGAAGSGAPGGAGGGMPSGHPPATQPPASGGDLPSGHPPVGGDAPAPSGSELPSGHPPVSP